MKNKDTTQYRRQAKTGSKQLSFLPEPKFNPKLPSRKTLAFRALKMMFEDKEISHPDFDDATSSWRLAAHILVLKKLGWPIETIDVIYSAVNEPMQRHICRYYLDKKIISKYKKLFGGGR